MTNKLPSIAIGIAEEAMQTAMDMDTRDGAKLDECAVRLLSEYQIDELAAKRAKGYGGWHEEELCSIQRLSDLFHAQVAKGNIIGAANYLAFLHARNAPAILPVLSKSVEQTLEIRDSGVVKASDAFWQSAEEALNEKPLSEFTDEEIAHFEHRASLAPVPNDGYRPVLHNGAFMAVAKESIQSGALVGRDQISIEFIGKVEPVHIVGNVIDPDAPGWMERLDKGAVAKLGSGVIYAGQVNMPALEIKGNGMGAALPGAFEVTDEELLALNAGEIHFSESPSRFPEAGFGTQYHAGAPGLLNFARAAIALATSKETESIAFEKAFNEDYLSAYFPTVHVVLKDGIIIATNDEPGHLEGIWSIPYRPMKDEDDGMLFRAMYEAVKNDDEAFMFRMDNIALDWEDEEGAPTFDQFRDAIREAMDASKAAAELSALADRHDVEGE